MKFKNTSQRYGIVTKSFHWSIFALFVIQFTIGFMIMGAAVGEHYDPANAKLLNWHHSIGLIILLLAIGRYSWRRMTPLPDWAETLSVPDRKVAHWVERLLYFVMIFKPLSGMALALGDGQDLMFFNQLSIPNFTGESETLVAIALVIHIITGLLFFGAWFVHIGMVFKHQWVKKDRLLNRMLPFSNQ
jgi:cytochrome b561